MFERFAEDLASPEGPVSLPDGSWLAVEMAEHRGCVSHISPDSSIRVIKKTGRPNGLAVDKDGYIWLAESSKPSLIRMDMDGNAEEIFTECDGEPFLLPNDLAFGPHGELYMTDSGTTIAEYITVLGADGKLTPSYKDLPIDGRVYEIDPKKMTIKKIDTGLAFTNGIAFGPDNYLYINETFTGNILRYRWENGHVVGGRELFSDVPEPGPDGMKFDADGKLYVTIFYYGNITVLDREGKFYKKIELDDTNPTNLAFPVSGERKIHITEVKNGGMIVVDTESSGLPLHK